MYIDTHCHLDFSVFDEQRDHILEQCRQLGFEALVVPGVCASDFERLQNLASQTSLIYAAYGLHPVFLAQHNAADLKLLAGRLEHDPAVAVGEIGLDFFLPDLDRAQQIELFQNQLKLAAEYALPVILHVRKAHDEVLALLRRHRFSHGGLVHAYSGSLQQAEQYLDLGFKLGVGGAATYERAKKLHRILQTLPLTAFVLETDAPDIPPCFATEHPNTPLHLPQITQILAAYRGIDAAEFAAACVANSKAILSLTKP